MAATQDWKATTHVDGLEHLKSPVVKERRGQFGQELELEAGHWRLKVGLGERLDPYELVDLQSGRYIADESYCYDLTVGPHPESAYQGEPLRCQRVRPIDWTVEEQPTATTLVLIGVMDFGPNGPTNIRIEHRFTLAASVTEELSIVSYHGREPYSLSNLRFGFRKTLFDRASFSWAPGGDSGELIPVPLRRRAGQGLDYHLDSYRAPDLYPEEWSRTSLPNRGAEGWLWREEGWGFLVAKYNQDNIEFSIADGEYVRPRSADGLSGDLQVDHLHSDRNLCLRFGGAGIIKGCPERASELGVGERLRFGSSIITTFDGDWRAGYAAYKKLLNERGHVIPAGYTPRVHWNELYGLGWRLGSNAPLQELPALWEEAALAKAAGAQAFYFDPGWDLFEGSSVWDAERLGPFEDFVATLKQEYGLSLALHIMVHTKSVTEDPAIYRRRQDGTIDLWKDGTPYVGGFACPASRSWQEQKTERLLRLCSAGASFLMFDFLGYGPCWSPDHGHSVPSSREEHAEGIMTVVRAIERECPEVTIEAHDRIGGEFLPLYYQHGSEYSHDELWGFEFMWDPYTDLVSGKALSLYEYNLAYDIPLYLHINSAHDSSTMLAFWWYASCCRHLGIGGVNPGSDQWVRLAAAMEKYRRLQPYFSRGRFWGLDQLTHLHVLDDEGGAVMAAFNLGSTPLRKTVVVTPDIMRLQGAPRVDGATATMDEGSLVVSLEVPALSPCVIEIDVPR